jgi:hypothetical protein
MDVDFFYERFDAAQQSNPPSWLPEGTQRNERTNNNILIVCVHMATMFAAALIFGCCRRWLQHCSLCCVRTSKQEFSCLSLSLFLSLSFSLSLSPVDKLSRSASLDNWLTDCKVDNIKAARSKLVLLLHRSCLQLSFAKNSCRHP